MKYGLKCPHCGQQKSFRTTMRTVVEIENGYIEHSEIVPQLNIYESIDCKRCGFEGITALFLQGNEDVDNSDSNPSGINFVGNVFSIRSKEVNDGETDSRDISV